MAAELLDRLVIVRIPSEQVENGAPYIFVNDTTIAA